MMKGDFFLKTIKYRKKPGVLLCYEALFRNLKEQYRNNRTLMESYNRYRAGYQGEMEVDYHLKQFPHEKRFVLHNIRLRIRNIYFQIDTLIMNENTIIILEAKNLSGIIEYDSELNQLVQYNKDKKTALRDPILQAETQKMHLQSWLQQFNISIPIDYLVVSSNPSTIINIKQNDPTIYQKLIRTESLHLHLNNLIEKYPVKVLTPRQIKKISSTIMKEDTPLHPNLIKRFNIQERHLKRSISCPTCRQTTMAYTQKKWRCQECNATAKNVHERYILDHFLLFSNTITNSQCRRLLHISSQRIIYNFLQTMALAYKGDNKGRVYLAPKMDDYPQESDFPGKYKSILDSFD